MLAAVAQAQGALYHMRRCRTTIGTARLPLLHMHMHVPVSIQAVAPMAMLQAQVQVRTAEGISIPTYSAVPVAAEAETLLRNTPLKVTM